MSPPIGELLDSTGFSGVVRVDADGVTIARMARGMANRAHGVPNRVQTRLAIASATKSVTALVIESLIGEGTLAMETTARSLLGADLPLVDDGVTVGHLLAHRSGIGDYLDEDTADPVNEHTMPVSAHRLDCTEAYVPVLDGHPQASAPGERFAYCNGGYVLLSLLAERAAGQSFADLIERRVCRPAGMRQTSFLRSDELPADAATGYLYLDRDRTNVFHLPVIGAGDGGLYSTVDDIHLLWQAFFDGRLVSLDRVEEMVRPSGEFPSGKSRYGLGFWLAADGPGVIMEGYDAGVSFRSMCDRAAGITWTVISNSTEGAWPVVQRLLQLLAERHSG